MEYVIAAWFAVSWSVLLTLHSLEDRDEHERRREAHIRRLERECGLEEYPWGQP